MKRQRPPRRTSNSLCRVSAERLHERFVRLCEVPSPTGSEREVADSVLAELRQLGVEVTEDGAAGPARAGAGNLLARVPGRDDRWVMFTAHLDTVPHDGPIEVVLADGAYRSEGETILGADNKAAVAVLIELLAASRARAARGRDRGPAHRRRGGRTARGEGLRHLFAAFDSRLRARPRDPDRGGDHGFPDLPADRRRLRGRRGARGNQARRRGTARSQPPRLRSRRCSSAASTRRRPRTSG